MDPAGQWDNRNRPAPPLAGLVRPAVGRLRGYRREREWVRRRRWSSRPSLPDQPERHGREYPSIHLRHAECQKPTASGTPPLKALGNILLIGQRCQEDATTGVTCPERRRRIACRRTVCRARSRSSSSGWHNYTAASSRTRYVRVRSTTRCSWSASGRRSTRTESSTRPAPPKQLVERLSDDTHRRPPPALALFRRPPLSESLSLRRAFSRRCRSRWRLASPIPPLRARRRELTHAQLCTLQFDASAKRARDSMASARHQQASWW